MAFSINTNQGALVALQQLTRTNQSLETTQNRISTGLEVAGAEDGAARFAIAQNLRADVGGLNAVQQSLDRTISTVDTAINGAEAVSDLLIQLRELAVGAADAGADDSTRDALNDEFQEVLAQIDSIVDSADFNGSNLLNGSTASVVAINANGSTVFSVAGTDLNLSSLASGALDGAVISQQASAAAAVGNIDTAIGEVNTALSSFGAGQTRLELQQDFTANLRDTLEVGIGNLVDADLARESAQLQALQVQQQLGLQALGIANQAPQSILALFG